MKKLSTFCALISKDRYKTFKLKIFIEMIRQIRSLHKYISQTMSNYTCFH